MDAKSEMEEDWMRIGGGLDEDRRTGHRGSSFPVTKIRYLRRKIFVWQNIGIFLDVRRCSRDVR